MRPVTSSHRTRSGTSSTRSGAGSIRTFTTASNATTRPFTASARGGSLRPGNQAANIPSSDFNKDFKRPVTAAGGLGNVQKASIKSFQNRQVHDATYCYSLLNTKEREIINEINKIKHDIEQFNSKNRLSSTNKNHNPVSHTDVETMYESLVKEVRELEGLLADHNVAKEKIRQGFDVEDVNEHLDELKLKNEKEANELDEIFVLKQKKVDEIKRVTKDIESMHDTIKQRLQGTNPALFDQYQKYQMHIEEIEAEGKAMEEEIQNLRDEHTKLQSVVYASEEYQIRKQYLSEQDKVNNLKKKLLQIDEDMNVASMSYQEAHSYLLDKAKKAQSRTKQLMQEENDIMKDIKSAEEQLQCMHNFNNGTNTEFGSNAHTNMESEEDIDEAIVKNKESLENIVAHIANKQDEVSGLLERMSRSIAISNNSKPTESDFKKLNVDKDFKAKNLANSLNTVTRLMDQKQKRMKELEMVENLEAKIAAEKKDLNSKMEIMRNESHLYSDLNRLEESDELTRLYLTQMRERYMQRCDFIRSKVKQISVDYELNQNVLRKSDVWKSLLNLEEKLRRQGQVVFSLQQAVEEKERKTNYESLKSKCQALTKDLLLEQ